MKNLYSAFLVLCCSLIRYSLAGSRSYPITTLVNAKWLVTPVHLEVAEFISEESPSLYWEYVGRLVKLNPEITSLGKYNLLEILSTCILTLVIFFS